MSRNYEKPVVAEEGGPMGGQRMTHPAFAQIAAARTTGQTYLYGSDFSHSYYIHIKISPSDTLRSHHQDWFFEKNVPYIDVALSEAQWATFVSSLNVGSGVPCTLQQRDGETVSDLPPPEDRKAKHVSEQSAAMADALKSLDRLTAKIAESGLSKKKADELAELVRVAHSKLSDSVPFISKMFDEDMEQTVEKAKIEINSYATQHLMSLGRAALESQTPILTLEDAK